METRPAGRRTVTVGRLVFLLEELSMKELLDGMLPRFFPCLRFLCIAHEGKADLDLSISKKLKNWHVPGDRFLILRDNDGGDCHELKNRLAKLGSDAGRDDTVVRIVCQELESWYLGQPEALAEAFGQTELRRISNRPSFRNPDNRPSPSQDLRRLLPEFRKVADVRRMAEYLAREGSSSPSFNAFMDAVTGMWGTSAQN